MKLKVKYLKNYLPEWDRLKYMREFDSAMDLRAAIPEPMVIEAGSFAVVPNGIQLEMISGDTTLYETQVRPRGGLAAKNGIIVHFGTVDWDYRGEYQTILFNFSKRDFVINPGDRISQLAICPIVRASIETADELSETVRGEGRFGSSGIN